MYLEHFKLKGFRNLASLDINFNPNVNIFLGNNAQGKTNLLEAIYFLALTRSHRISNDRELISFDSDYASLEGLVQKSQLKTDLRVVLSKSGKRVWINHLQQKKISDYVGQFNAILFSPEDLDLVKGSPGERRKFMDIEFGQISAEYLYYASRYRQILQQKNNYLKQLAKQQAVDKLFLTVLSDQLSGVAAEIIHRRFKYLKRLGLYASDAYRQISLGRDELSIVYRPSVKSISENDSPDDIYQKMRQEFADIQDKEIRRSTTLLGPHRDDIEFRLDGKNAHLFASQGQQRTIALSIKLAEIQLVHDLTDEYPVLLLDDVMSELDHDRQGALLNYIHGKTQTFITTTDLTGISWEIINQPQIYHIESGVLEKEEG